jgi:uncharacterized repeat protein (TIGR03803 family)
MRRFWGTRPGHSAERAWWQMPLACATIGYCVLPFSAFGASFTTIYSFTGGPDGGEPLARLVPDRSGNLYSVTKQGGDFSCLDSFQGCGTVFKLDRRGKLTTLHVFTGGAQGGDPTSGISVIRGALYGGSLGNAAGFTGVVWTIKTDGTGYTVLHGFTAADGSVVQGQLQSALNGGEFGITREGGAYNNGTLFYIGPLGQFEDVHDFGGASGGDPSELIEDASGNLFGSTNYGGDGTRGTGVVFEYAQRTRAFSVLYTFQNGADGGRPKLGPVGPNGTLYGVSTTGGSKGHGALFSLTPSDGVYTFQVLTPIESIYHGDTATNPPALSVTGALVGSTSFGGTYEYQTGQYTISYKADAAAPSDSYWLPPTDPTEFFNTSFAGGSGACAIPDVSECGFIYGISP